MDRIITIALAGNPNSGKTSLFNSLTGARAHVGNYPGVTVEKKAGYHRHGDREIHVVDLPGTYSLTAYSLEELVARNFVLDERPDVVVDVVDAANLERNLYLTVQFMEIGVPVVVALNMVDMAESRGLSIDLAKLRDLLGLEVAPTVARSGRGLDELMEAVLRTAARTEDPPPRRIRYGPDLDPQIDEISGLLEKSRLETDKYPPRWLAIKLLEGDRQVRDLLDQDPASARRINQAVEAVARHIRTTLDDEPEGIIADHRYGFITSVTKQAVTSVRDIRRTFSDLVDLAALNRLLGPLLLLAVLYGVYQFTFLVSEPFVGWFESFFAWLSGAVREMLPEGLLQSLIASGIIDGVGGVLGFVPLIAFMFFAIAILEDSGYMARIAFIMDRVLRTFGLHGSSVLALMVGGGLSGGCAVPGVMAARTLRDPKERLATILVTPFMNCGAKLPVYAVLIGAFFSHYRGQMMFLLTLIAWAMAMLSARLLRWSILKGRQTPFVMELPPYRLPTVRGLLIHTWERVWAYIKKAGTVILAISVVLWALMTFPGPPEDLERVFEHQRRQVELAFRNSPAAKILKDEGARAEFEAYLEEFRDRPRPGRGPEGPPGFADLARGVLAYEAGEIGPESLSVMDAAARDVVERHKALARLEGAADQAGLKFSAAGRIGRTLEPLTAPLSFDWRTNIALIGGFAAKEVILATLGTAYSLSQTEIEAEEPLSRRLAATPGWTPLSAFVLMLFVMLYAPCFVTLAVITREAGWRWALFALIYNTALAYVICAALNTAGRALGLGT
ncbi:MAG: ferrous iron transport protein B [Thermodesulfobacteriota bacterium]